MDFTPRRGSSLNRADQLRTHWDRKIARWDAEAYEAEASSGSMARLRKSVDARLQTALAVLRPHVAGKAVLDLGCGAGRLAIEAVKSLGATRAHGIDLSPVAIERARALAQAAGVANQVTFAVESAITEQLPPADITVGLGLLDWLNHEETETLLGAVEGRKFVLSYSEQDWSPAEIVHRIYLVYRLRLFGRGVRARHHRREEMLGLLRRHGLVPCEIVFNRAMRFGRIVHNLSDLRAPAPKPSA
jgi:SAM-dependent methyltransferase